MFMNIVSFEMDLCDFKLMLEADFKNVPSWKIHYFPVSVDKFESYLYKLYYCNYMNYFIVFNLKSCTMFLSE